MEEGIGIERDRDGLIAKRVRRETKRWRIVGVYAKKVRFEGILGDLERWADEREEGIRTIVGGDFNARTGRKGESREGKWDWDKEGGREEDRRTKNFTRKKRYWIKFVEKGWEIFNGNIRGDEEGEYTYSRAIGSTDIDYVLGDKEVKESTREMTIRDKVDSDHYPVEVVIKKGINGRGKSREGSRVWRGV